MNPSGPCFCRCLSGRIILSKQVRQICLFYAISALLYFCSTSRTFGAAGDYLIDITTGEKGLPNSSVTAIAQTKDGYLWVGTYNGLARFDGERFVKYYPENTPALKHARIRRLVKGPDGTLWISAHDGSITSYRNGKFAIEWTGEGLADSAATLISTRSNRPVFLLRTGEFIRRLARNGTNEWEMLRVPGAGPGQQVAEDSDGTIWCASRDQRIYRLNGSVFEALADNGGLTGEVNVLTADARGRIWAGTDRELGFWNGKRFEDMTPTNGAAVSNVSFLRVLSNGDVWSIANQQLRKSHGREWVLEVEQARGLFTGWRERTGLHEDSKGGVWLYDYGRGMLHIRPDGRVRQLAAEQNFPGERVDAFLEDREGNIWAGVDRGGLVRVREKQRFSVLLPGESAGDRAAVSVTEDAAGTIWVGTFGGGLHRWYSNEWQTFTLPGGTRRGFVFSVATDANGKIWTSAGDEDLYSGSDGRFTAFVPAVHGVKCLLRASDQRLWVGIKSGLGVISGEQFRQLGPEDGVGRTDVRALVEDANGSIWAGTGDGTLYRINSNNVAAFRHNDAWAGQPIWSLLADSDGSIWIGTFRGGLMRFHEGKFTRITTRDGLPDDVICQLLDDGAGRLWAGTKQGIFHVNKTELNNFIAGQTDNINCTSYGRYDGLPDLECSDSYQPAACRTRDGRLLFTTLKGVVSVRPGDVAANTLPPPVVIEGATLDGREQPPEAFAATGLIPRLRIPPGTHQIKIQFTGLSFISPDRVRFQYKLEGLDDEWSEPSTARSVQYNLLPPGEHRFLVRACNNDGVWNDQGAELTLLVSPHFYETWTFKLAVALAAAGIVAFSVRRVYARRLRRQLEQLERQRAIERDRARIAKDIHDDLGAGLTHIALLSELARRDTPDEMPHHVSQISEMARELTRNMDEIVWAVDPHNDTLESLVTYVSKFAQEYLSVAGIRCRLDVPAELPPHALPAEVRHNLFLAIKEALNNVVKHAGATEVWLRVVLQPNSFCVTVEDNGCGLACQNGHRNGNAGTVGSNGRLSSGHGLLNMERRLASIGGNCVIRGEPGQGTRAELRVDLSPRSPELVTGE